MAGVRNMGICPCPRCLIKKTELPALGTLQDDKRRKKLRVNNYHLRTKVAITRGIIYGKGTPVYADAVNDILKSESLVPTTVRCLMITPPRSCPISDQRLECIPHHIC